MAAAFNSSAAMSCQRGLVRWRASMAAASNSSAAMSCRRGLVRWRASMAATLRKSSIFIKTRHCVSGCGRVVLSGLGSSRLRKACHPCLSAHVIPAWKRAWHGIYGQKACKIYALRSRPLSCPFLLTGKDQRVKADIMGPPHKAGAPPPCRPWPARPTWTRLGIPTQKTFL